MAALSATELVEPRPRQADAPTRSVAAAGHAATPCHWRDGADRLSLHLNITLGRIAAPDHITLIAV